jgi:hypothetical protein
MTRSFVYTILAVILLWACSEPQKTKEQHDTEEIPEIQKIIGIPLKATQPAFAEYIARFPSVAIPYSSLPDSNARIAGQLSASEVKQYIIASQAAETKQYHIRGRLPDSGQAIVLLYRAIAQEGGQQELLLISYSTTGKPIAELLLHYETDTEQAHILQQATIEANYIITLSQFSTPADEAGTGVLTARSDTVLKLNEAGKLMSVK